MFKSYKMATYYSVDAASGSAGDGPSILHCYVKVVDGFITNFYDLTQPIPGSGYVDVLLPTNDTESFNGASNAYPFDEDDNGTNFTSNSLQTFFGTTSNHFNIFDSLRSVPFKLRFYQELVGGSLLMPDYNVTSVLLVSEPAPPPVCFLGGSKLLTDKGYVAIECLKVGDLLKTLKHGFKKVDILGKQEFQHPSVQERIKDQLYKCSKSEYPQLLEDLVITGCHCILEDEFKDDVQKEKAIEVNRKIFVTDDKYRVPACADLRTSVYEPAGTYTIYHLALENDNYFSNYGVYANGLLVETCSKRYLKELSNMILTE